MDCPQSRQNHLILGKRNQPFASEVSRWYTSVRLTTFWVFLGLVVELEQLGQRNPKRIRY
jgi:hypothetical protein